MDDQEREEYLADAEAHGIPLMLDRMGMDGLGNEVIGYLKRIRELEAICARRCWTCRQHVYLSHGGNAYTSDNLIACPMFGRAFESQGFCHRWAARDREEGVSAVEEYRAYRRGSDWVLSSKADAALAEETKRAGEAEAERDTLQEALNIAYRLVLQHAVLDLRLHLEPYSTDLRRRVEDGK